MSAHHPEHTLDNPPASSPVDAVAHWQRLPADSLAGVVAQQLLRRADGCYSYQLAVVVDDAMQGISHVVRGADLRVTTDVHRLLQALLTLPTPIYQHHPLIGDAMGRRLAKRDGAASLAAMRDAGVDGLRLAADLTDGKLPLGYCWVKA